jgi:hypothetical protein
MFFDIKEIVHKEFGRQAKQSILYTTVTFCGDCVRMCQVFTPNFVDKRTGCCVTRTHCLTLPFSQGNFLPKTTRPSPPTYLTSLTYPPATFLCFFPLKKKLNGRHFHTIEVIEAESQAVLNTLTKHDFQDAFKNGSSAGNGAYARKGTISRVMVASKLNVSF